MRQNNVRVILPLDEHDWSKWSHDKFGTHDLLSLPWHLQWLISTCMNEFCHGFSAGKLLLASCLHCVNWRLNPSHKPWLWWSVETWCRSRDPFLRVSVSVSKVSGLVSVSKVSGLVSVSEVSGLETLNIAKEWFIKISIIQRFFVAFAGTSVRRGGMAQCPSSDPKNKKCINSIRQWRN